VGFSPVTITQHSYVILAGSCRYSTKQRQSGWGARCGLSLIWIWEKLLFRNVKNAYSKDGRRFYCTHLPRGLLLKPRCGWIDSEIFRPARSFESQDHALPHLNWTDFRGRWFVPDRYKPKGAKARKCCNPTSYLNPKDWANSVIVWPMADSLSTSVYQSGASPESRKGNIVWLTEGEYASYRYPRPAVLMLNLTDAQLARDVLRWNTRECRSRLIASVRVSLACRPMPAWQPQSWPKVPSVDVEHRKPGWGKTNHIDPEGHRV